MYIWIGCKLPVAFEQEIRQRCLALNRKLGLDTAAFSLPQHVSLKISFSAEEPEAILQFLQEFLAGQQAFGVTVQTPEQMGNILWLPITDQPMLPRLHQQLDDLLTRHFGIPQHPFELSCVCPAALYSLPDAQPSWASEQGWRRGWRLRAEEGPWLPGGPWPCHSL